MKSNQKQLVIVVILVILLAIAISGVTLLGYFYWSEKIQRRELKLEKEELENQLIALKDSLATTSNALLAEQARTNAFADELSGLASTVETLDKLSKTDKELLQKYSKIYFLNENYIPDNLATITPIYIHDQQKSLKIHAHVLDYLESLMQAALLAGFDLKILSAYRSFGQQAELKAQYSMTYGAGANKFSADQGYSEHQLGTAVDFILAGTPTLSVDFGKTSASDWLKANAHRFGFILSYPPGNAYYQYEPWHWRYVGVALATRLHDENKNFYDLPQRIIDQYLVNIFD